MEQQRSRWGKMKFLDARSAAQQQPASSRAPRATSAGGGATPTAGATSGFDASGACTLQGLQGGAAPAAMPPKLAEGSRLAQQAVRLDAPGCGSAQRSEAAALYAQSAAALRAHATTLSSDGAADAAAKFVARANAYDSRASELCL